MSSAQQIPFAFNLLALPEPKVLEDQIRDGDLSIGDDALSVPRQLKHGMQVLGAIEGLNRSASLNGLIYPPVTVGYTQIQKNLKELYGIVLAHSSIESTLKHLLRLGFLKCSRRPDFDSRAQYQTLTPEGKLAMLRGVNATHHRIYRNRVLLITPVYGRLHVI